MPPVAGYLVLTIGVVAPAMAPYFLSARHYFVPDFVAEKEHICMEYYNN